MIPLFDKKKFNKICQKYELSLVILHGSYAKNTAISTSDIDIGILGRLEVIKEKYFDILGDFSECFGDKFDPVFLNGAEALITYYVTRDGMPLYERKEGLFNSFKLAALTRYQDTKKFRVLEREYIKSAIQKI